MELILDYKYVWVLRYCFNWRPLLLCDGSSTSVDVSIKSKRPLKKAIFNFCNTQETVKHILLEFKRYEEERRELETQVGEQNMTVGNRHGKIMSKTHSLLMSYLKYRHKWNNLIEIYRWLLSSYCPHSSPVGGGKFTLKLVCHPPINLK